MAEETILLKKSLFYGRMEIGWQKSGLFYDRMKQMKMMENIICYIKTKEIGERQNFDTFYSKRVVVYCVWKSIIFQ